MLYCPMVQERQLPLLGFEDLAPRGLPPDQISESYLWDYFESNKDFYYLNSDGLDGLVIIAKDEKAEVERILIMRLYRSGRLKGRQILMEQWLDYPGKGKKVFSIVDIRREADFFEFKNGDPVGDDDDHIAMIQLGLLEMGEAVFSSICKKITTELEVKEILKKRKLLP